MYMVSFVPMSPMVQVSSCEATVGLNPVTAAPPRSLMAVNAVELVT